MKNETTTTTTTNPEAAGELAAAAALTAGALERIAAEASPSIEPAELTARILEALRRIRAALGDETASSARHSDWLAENSTAGDVMVDRINDALNQVPTPFVSDGYAARRRVLIEALRRSSAALSEHDCSDSAIYINAPAMAGGPGWECGRCGAELDSKTDNPPANIFGVRPRLTSLELEVAGEVCEGILDALDCVAGAEMVGTPHIDEDEYQALTLEALRLSCVRLGETPAPLVHGVPGYEWTPADHGVIGVIADAVDEGIKGTSISGSRLSEHDLAAALRDKFVALEALRQASDCIAEEHPACPLA